MILTFLALHALKQCYWISGKWNNFHAHSKGVLGTIGLHLLNKRKSFMLPYAHALFESGKILQPSSYRPIRQKSSSSLVRVYKKFQTLNTVSVIMICTLIVF